MISPCRRMVEVLPQPSRANPRRFPVLHPSGGGWGLTPIRAPTIPPPLCLNDARDSISFQMHVKNHRHILQSYRKLSAGQVEGMRLQPPMAHENGQQWPIHSWEAGAKCTSKQQQPHPTKKVRVPLVPPQWWVCMQPQWLQHLKLETNIQYCI